MRLPLALAAILAASLAAPARAQSTRAEARTGLRMASLRTSTPQLYAFLRAMPKGADTVWATWRPKWRSVQPPAGCPTSS